MKSRRYLRMIMYLYCFGCILNSAVAQEIITADTYFEQVSAVYGRVTDYEGRITITEGDNAMEGNIWYKNPNLLLIRFTSPENQYLLVNGEALTVFVPEHSVLLKQYLPRRSKASIAAMASSQGLTYLRNNYKIAYVYGPDPIPLEEGSKEMVVKLKFQWRATAEGFKDIEISFTDEGLIRRVKAVTATNINIQFDFHDLKINQGILEEMFDIPDPPTAYEYKNFLFGDEE
ncbi:MAG: outer membrane lipoprotein carrier protein LolA [Spirochaetales bacterium]|nr:outer membrane lipoprotein carrier protein LolA [Spirochaetales bacterium]